MGERKTYRGGCHCGAVAFEATSGLEPVVSCNCSLCHKRGLLLTFVPAADFRLLAGEDCLEDYRFNRKVIRHLFCRTCGVESFARSDAPDGTPMVAVNVRCLDGVELEGLATTSYDGRAH